MNKLDGYGEAQKIDGQINDLLEKHNMTKENIDDWARFTRTIGTSLKLIEEKVKQIRDAISPKRRWND